MVVDIDLNTQEQLYRAKETRLLNTMSDVANHFLNPCLFRSFERGLFLNVKRQQKET